MEVEWVEPAVEWAVSERVAKHSRPSATISDHPSKGLDLVNFPCLYLCSKLRYTILFLVFDQKQWGLKNILIINGC